MSHKREEIAEVVTQWLKDGHPSPKTVLDAEEVLKWYYGAGGYNKPDVDMVLSLVPTESAKTAGKQPLDVNDILALPFVDEEGQIAVYINTKRKFKGKPRIFTIRYTAEWRTYPSDRQYDMKGVKAERYLHIVAEEYPQRLMLPDGIAAVDTERAAVTQPSLAFLESDMSWSQAFDALESIYKKHLYFTDAMTYKMLALTAMSTYFREAFSRYPNIGFVSSIINTGKTTATTIFVQSCYYGTMQTSPTPASMYRETMHSHGVQGFDQLDVNLKRKDGAGGSMMNVLDAAHFKGTTVVRMNMVTNLLEAFDCSGTKTYNRKSDVHQTLKSRTIDTTMRRKPKGMRLSRYHSAKVFEEARDALYLLRLERSQAVALMAKNQEIVIKALDNRAKDLFIPPLTMARLVDSDRRFLATVAYLKSLKKGDKCDLKTIPNDPIYNDVLKWAIDYEADRAKQLADDWLKALTEVLCIALGTAAEAEVTTANDGVGGAWRSLLLKRGLMKEKDEPKVKQRLVTMNFQQVVHKTSGRKTYFLIDRENLSYHAEMHGVEIQPLEGGAKK